MVGFVYFSNFLIPSEKYYNLQSCWITLYCRRFRPFPLHYNLHFEGTVCQSAVNRPLEFNHKRCDVINLDNDHSKY